tara:strand:+ start:1422 stop:2006 length:585 start_codon:yes stop_codon:yes gene_type:complete
MNEEQTLELFESVGAIQHGHFILSSGKRSRTYCQCSKLFIDPKIGSKVCGELKSRIEDKISSKIDLIISPALGGLLVGYELARSIGCEFMFYERLNEEFQLRRDFFIKEKANILFVEDVITTGKSTKECLNKLSKLNINLLGIASVVDRSITSPFDNFEIISLLKINIPVYDEENLPDELKKIEPIKPGSRNNI